MEEKRIVKPWQAGLMLLVVIAVIIVGLLVMKLNNRIVLALDGVIMCLMAWCFGIPYAELQQGIKGTVSSMIVAILILLAVGVLVGTWMAVCTGAFFGDKVSPLSDSPVITATVCEVPLMDGIRHALISTGPAYLISLVFYFVYGLRYSGGSVGGEVYEDILSTVSAEFWLSPVLLLPVLVVVVLILMKKPTIPAFIAGIAAGAVMAMLCQGVSLHDILTVMYSGFSADTGSDVVNSMLNRGGFTSMLSTIGLLIEAGLSKGTYQLVAEDVIHADYAIMGECRYDNVAVGFRGRYSFEVTVHGQTAHASHYPEVGENALISGGRLTAAIEALPTLQHPHLKHGTCCVRYMEGGNPGTLVVPEKCYLFVERYVVPGETDEICIAQIMGAAEQLGLSGKVDVRLKPRKSPYMQSFAVEEDHPLVKILQEEFHSVTGKDLPCAYDASVCDSNILAVSLGLSGRDVRPLGRQHAR